jgi:two-component system nitrate/nitrite response regulator NarL
MSGAALPPATRTVLLVDDTAHVRIALAAALDTDDRWVLLGEAPHGRAAVEFAAEQCPDVIVLDQHMPHLTGLDAAPLLRESCPNAHIVMWSSDAAVAPQALRSGAVDAFVEKSEPLDALLAAMSAA